MSTTTFNALTTTRDLEAASFERKQAEALAEAMYRAATAERDEFATKADPAALRADMYRALWIQGAGIVGAQIAIGGFIVHLPSQ